MTTETSSRANRPSGPIDSTPWPKKLAAFVVDKAEPTRIHGYAVESDLACHYGFAEVTLLSILGELPSEESAAAFNAALVILAPVAVSERPGRAALLAGLTAGEQRASLEVGWVALSQRGSRILEQYAGFLDWLDAECVGPSPDLEATAGPASDIVVTWSERCPGLRPNVGSVRAALCLLHHSGVRSRDKMLLCICIAGISTIVTEAAKGAKLGFKGQPGDLPTTRVIEAERE